MPSTSTAMPNLLIRFSPINFSRSGLRSKKLGRPANGTLTLLLASVGNETSDLGGVFNGFKGVVTKAPGLSATVTG